VNAVRDEEKVGGGDEEGIQKFFWRVCERVAKGIGFEILKSFSEFQ